MKRRITILLALVIIVTLALPQIVWADGKAKDKTYRFESGVLPYSAQMEGETAIRISWFNLMASKGFILSWKETGSTQKAGSVRIDQPEKSSYVVTDLKPETEYTFELVGILTGANGKDLLSKPRSISGATYLQTPKFINRELMADYIITKWTFAEKDAALKLYRAETKSGPYELIATIKEDKEKETGGGAQFTAAGDEEESDYFKPGELSHREDQHMAAMYKDVNVKADKSYYYKTQAERRIEGKLYKSKESETVKLAAKNFDEAGFLSKLMNKKGTYTNQVTFRITSQKGNYRTYLKRLTSLYAINNTGRPVKKAVRKTEYSLNGKTFELLKNKSVKIDPGESVYIRISTKKKIWLRKDGKVKLHFDVKYCRPSDAGKVDGADLEFTAFDRDADWIPSWGQRKEGQIKGGKCIWDAPLSELDDLIKYGSFGDLWLKAERITSTSVLLYWNSVRYVENYAIRYGLTKSDVVRNKPIILPKCQVEHLVKGLKKGKTYYFSITPMNDSSDDVYWEDSSTVNDKSELISVKFWLYE